MNSSRKTLSLAQICYRRLSKAADCKTEVVTEKVHPGYAAIKEKQKKFGVDDNVPVFLKGGRTDKICYQLTTLLTVIGFGLSLQTFWELTFK